MRNCTDGLSGINDYGVCIEPMSRFSRIESTHVEVVRDVCENSQVLKYVHLYMF